MAKRSFQVTNAWLTFWAVGAAVAGLALLTLAAWIQVGSGWDTGPRAFFGQLAAALGGAGVSLGIALLISEVGLKPAFVSELFKVANLQERVQEIGFRDFGEPTGIDFPTLFSKAASVEVLISHPSLWAAQHRSAVLACARRHCVVKLYLPKPESDFSASSAAVFGLGQSEYNAQIERFVEDFKNGWSEVQPVHYGSELQILFVELAPQGDMYLFGTESVITVTGGAAEGPGAWLYLHQAAGESDAHRWLDARWARIRSRCVPGLAWASSRPPLVDDEVAERLGTELLERDEGRTE